MMSTGTSTAWSRTLIIVAILGLGMALYAPSVGLLLFWDDVPHMQWLGQHGGGAYWLTAEDFPFYRPATFAVWELLQTIIGYHHAPVLHGLSVALHVANALLVCQIATRLTGRNAAGLGAGLLFVAFPFNYQAIIPVAAHFHLWLVFSVLGAAWLLLQWFEQPDRWRLVTAWLWAFWGIFSHENGVLAPFLIGAILLAAGHWSQRRRLVLALSPLVVMAGLYGLAWLVIPKGNEATGLELTALDVKIGQTLQAIGFPLAAVLQYSIDSASETLLAWTSGVIVVGSFGAWLLLRPANLRLALVSLAWVPLAMLPAWLLLDVNYLLGSPRLGYLASVGVAWFWGAVLGRAYRWTAIGMIVCLAVAIPFVRARVIEHYETERLYTESAVGGDNVLLVNGPAYLAPRHRTFPLGAEGSTYLPAFINLGDWLELNRLRESVMADIRHAPDIVPTTDRIVAITHPVLDRSMIATYDRVFTLLKLDDQVYAPIAGDHLPDGLAGAALADYGNGVVLEQGKLVPVELSGESYVRLDLVWRVEMPLDAPVAIFAHLLCDETRVAQADGPPLGRVYPFERWMPGERWRDYRYFDAPDQECLQALVGLYDPATGQRLAPGGVLLDHAQDDQIQRDFTP